MSNDIKPFIASYIFISISSNTNASLPVGSSLLEKYKLCKFYFWKSFVTIVLRVIWLCEDEVIIFLKPVSL